MARYDPEIEQLRGTVHCAAVLERQSPPWRLDRKESTKRSLKYRRTKGEVLIVTHEGKGWWDPKSEARGDVFDLIQYFDRSLTFGHVRRILREFSGIAPTFPETERQRQNTLCETSPAARWARQPLLKRGSTAWRYLHENRRLPPHILSLARDADLIRSGPRGSAWFTHRDDAGNVTHVEIRRPSFRGSLRGGTKLLFRLKEGSEAPAHLILTEAPIDALSLAAIEGPRMDTLYAATGGGMGPSTIAAIERLLAQLASLRGAIFCSGTDANPAGDRYALTHQQLAAQAKIAFARLKGASAWADAKIASAARHRDGIDAADLRAAVRVYADYQQRLREANAADFGDLLLWPVLAMHRDENYRDRWASRFDCLLADEYQDVNLAQYSWLKALTADHRRLFVVGDDDQAIYSWRGSDIAYIRRFTRDFPGAQQIRLEENFRSTGHILAAANAIIARDEQRLKKTLFTRQELGTPVEIVSFRDATSEAAGIAIEIELRHAEGAGFDEMAILYRNNFMSRGFEEALMRAHIPYALVGDVGFYQRAEIEDALALLRLAATPESRQSDEAFRRVINAPRRGFGAKAMEALETEASFRNISLLQAIETAPLPPKARAAGLAFADQIRHIADDESLLLAERLSLLLDTTGCRAMLRDTKADDTGGRLENLDELITLAGSFHSARELLDHAALATSRPNEDQTSRVRLMTLHKAKGLEFGHVFLPAWEVGSFPSDYGDPGEERRLAYVALTRAMRHITITHSAFRRGLAKPSPFISEIPQAHRVEGWLRAPNHQRSVRARSTSKSARL
ncbi:MAG TPA: 3'-5' exonuclease [Methylocella sp.]|nr:3'-5' exonuclease [Methylocella sp.]